MSVLDLLSCIDLPTSYWSTSNRNVGRVKHEKGEILTKKRSQLQTSSTPACLPSVLDRRQNYSLLFREHCNVPYSIKFKLLLLSESKDKIYIILYLHSACWDLSVLHIQSQKMGKRLYTTPRRTCISIPSAACQLVSAYQRDVFERISLGRQRRFPFSFWMKSRLMTEQKLSSTWHK